LAAPCGLLATTRIPDVGRALDDDEFSEALAGCEVNAAGALDVGDLGESNIAGKAPAGAVVSGPDTNTEDCLLNTAVASNKGERLPRTVVADAGA
jgi:hypothetical protein